MGAARVIESEDSINRMRYAQMPGESLCSENLTPWMKLLPCKGLKGLTSLLLPTALFRSNYNAVKVDLRRICWVCGQFFYPLTPHSRILLAPTWVSNLGKH